MASIHDPSTFKPITEHLDAVHQNTGLRTYDVYTNWLEFVVTALTRDDDPYLQLVDDLVERLHGDQETAGHVLESYGTALGALVQTMSETTVPGSSYPAELLGGIYEHYGASSDAFGQHFTPQNVAIFKATLAFPTPQSIRDATPSDPIRVSDPTCGSGRLAFHAMHRLRDIAPDTPTVVVARDIDKACAHMTVINFALHAIPAYVVHGNSLTYETWHVWRTNHPTRLITDPDVDGVVTELDPDDAPIITNPPSGESTVQDDVAEDLEDDLRIDDPETPETVTLDAFTQ